MRITNEHHDESPIAEMVEGFKKLKGWKLFWELTKWVFTGIFMGSSDAIPGYSGGTTLALLGFFKRLIFIAKSVFVPEPGLTRMKAFTFLLPFGIGWFAGVFLAAQVIRVMLMNDLGLELVFFFSAFIMFAIPMFLKSERPHLTKKHTGYKKRWVYFGIGFAVILALSLLLRFLPEPVGYDGNWSVEYSVEKEEAQFDKNWAFDFSDWWKLMLVAYFGGCITLIPGGSGAVLQLLSGMYPEIHAGILAHPTGNHFANLGAVAIYAVSTFSGLVTMVFIMTWFLRKHESSLAAVSFGMLLASIAAVLIAPDFANYSNFKHWEHALGASSAWLIGAGCGIGLNIIVNRKAIRDLHNHKIHLHDIIKE